MHPLMDDISTLTDTQLLDKITKTAQRLAGARSAGLSYGVLMQIEMVMLSYQEELNRRNEPEVDKKKDAWNMEKYLEENRDELNPTVEEDIPRWQSATFNDGGDVGTIEGGGSFLD